MADVQQTYSFKFDFNRKDIKKQLKEISIDVKDAIVQMSNVTDKVTIFKELMTYLSNVDRALNDFKSKHKDDFVNIFGTPDADLTKMLEGIFGITQQAAQGFATLKDKIKEAESSNASLTKLRGIAQEINDLFVSIGQVPPIDIESKFTGKGSKKEGTDFTGRIKLLDSALDEFGETYSSIQDRLKGGFGFGGSGGDSGISKEIQKKIDELNQKKKDLQEIIDAVEGKPIKIETTKSNDLATMNKLLQDYAAITKEVNSIEFESLPLEDRNKKIAERIKLATLLANTADDIAANDKNHSSKAFDLATFGESLTTIENAKEYLKNFHAESQMKAEQIKKLYSDMIIDVNTQLKTLQSPAGTGGSGGFGGVVSEYDKLNKKLEEYYDLQKQLESVDSESAEGANISDRQRAIADEIYKFKELTEKQEDDFYSIFDNIDEGAIKLEDALERLCDVLKIDIPSATGGSGSGDGPLDKMVSEAEYMQMLAMQIKSLFGSINSMSGSIEYKILVNGQEIDILQGGYREVSEQTNVEALLGTLGKKRYVSAHNHPSGNSSQYNATDFNTAISDTYNGISAMSMIVGENDISTLNLAGVKLKDALSVLKQIKSLNVKSVSAEKINELFKAINPEYGDVAKMWQPSQLHELSKYIYKVGESANLSIDPLEQFKGILKSELGEKVDLSKYEQLFSDFKTEDATSIFNKIMESEGKKLRVQSVKPSSLSEFIDTVEHQQKALLNLRNEAEITYSDIHNMIKSYMSDLNVEGDGEKRDIDAFIKQYFGKDDQANINQWLRDLMDGRSSVEQVTNQIAGYFKKIDPSEYLTESMVKMQAAQEKLKGFLDLSSEISNIDRAEFDDVSIGRYTERLEAAKKELDELGNQGLITAEELAKVQSAFDESKSKLETPVQSKTYSLESLYENGSESAKKAIQEYAELSAEMNEMWAFLNKTSHERPQGFTDPWSQTDEQKDKFINTAKEYQNVIKQISDLEIVANTEDDKNRLIALKKEAIELQRYLQFAVLADGNLESYQRVYGLPEDDARQFMMSVRNGYDTSRNFAEQIRQEYEARQDAKLAQIEELNPEFGTRMFKDVGALTEMLDKLVATQAKLNGGEVKTALQTFLDLTEEIKGKSFPLGNAEGNVEIGKYIERLEAARNALIEVAQAGQLTSEELKQAEAAFAETQSHLNDYVTHYDGYGSGYGEYEYTYEEEYHDVTRENERLRHDLELSEKQYQDVKEENERIRAEIVDLHQDVSGDIKEETAARNANAEALKNEGDRLERLRKLKHEIGLASMYATFYDQNADEDPTDFLGQKALQEKEKLLKFLGDNPSETEDDLKVWAKQLQDKMAPIEESARRISKLSALPKGLSDTNEMYQEAGKVGQQISKMYDDGITDTEEFIALQHKLLKIFDAIKAAYGGVKGSGAKDDFELNQWIYSSMKQDTGFDYYSGSLVDALYNSKHSIYDPDTGKKRSMRDMAAGLLEYESDYLYGKDAYDADSNRLKDVQKVLQVIEKRREQLFKMPIVDDNAKDDLQVIENNNKSLKEKINILKEISKAYTKMYDAKVAYDEADTPAQEDRAEQKLESTTAAVEELKKQYYSLIVTMQDGSKIDLKLEDDFEEAAESIIANAKRIQDIEIIPGSFGAAIEAYERIDYIKNNVTDSINRSWGRVSYKGSSDALEYLNRVKKDLETQVNNIEQSDPAGKFDFTNATQSAQELLSTINGMLPKFEMIAQAEKKINELGIKPDESDIYDVVEGVKNGVFTTVDQCVDKFKELTNFVDDDLTSKTDVVDTQSVTEESAQLDLLLGKVNEVKEAVDLKTQAFKEEGNVVDSVVQQEADSLNKLKATLIEVEQAVQTKTQTFISEGAIVSQVVDEEVSALTRLSDLLTTVQNIISQINLSEIDIKTGNLESIINAAAGTTTSAGENPHYVTDPQGNPVTMYRGIHGVYGGLVSNRYHGGTFSTSDIEVAKTYAGVLGKVEKVRLSMKNPFEIDGNGKLWKNLDYIGDNADEASKKLHLLHDEIKALNQEITQLENTPPTERELKLINRGLLTETPNQARLREATESRALKQAEVDAIYADKSNPYGIKTTNEIVELAKSSGYDGVIFKDIVDSASKHVSQASTVMVTFTQDQIHYLETIRASFDEAVESFKRQFGELARYIDTTDDQVKEAVTQLVDLRQKTNTGEITDEEYKALLSQNSLMSDVDKLADRAGLNPGWMDMAVQDESQVALNQIVNGIISFISQMKEKMQKLESTFNKTDILADKTFDDSVSKTEDVNGGASTSGASPLGDYALENTLQQTNTILSNILTAIGNNETLGNLVDPLKSAVDELRNVANGIIDHQKAQRTDLTDSSARIANNYGQLSSIAGNATAGLGEEYQIENMKALADNVVRVRGAVQDADGVWKGFVVDIDESNNAVVRAVEEQSAFAKSLNESAEAAKKAAQETKNVDNKTKEAGAEDKFAQSLSATKYAFNEYRKNIQDVDYLNNEVKQSFDDLATRLATISDADGLKGWKSDLETLKDEVSVAKEVFEKVELDKIQQIRGQVNAEFKNLDFTTTTSSPTDEQREILDLRKQLIAQLEEYKIGVKNGKEVELDSINQTIVALRQKINAYRDANDLTGGSKQKFGATAVLNATAKYNTLSQQASSGEFANSHVIQQAFQQYEVAYNNLIAKRKELAQVEGSLTDTQKAEFKELQNECNNYGKILSKIITDSQKLQSNSVAHSLLGEDFEDSAGGRQAALRDFVENLDVAGVQIGEFKDNFNQLTYVVDNGDGTFTEMTATINSARTAIDAVAGTTKKATGVLESFFNELKGKFKSISAYIIATVSIYDVIRVVRKGVEYVREIDSALAELKKVTDETDASYNRFLQDMSKTAGVIGSTASELTTMAADWARLGYSMEEAGKLAESTAILLNVSEFEDATRASEALISTMQAFQYTADESQHVVDILNEVKVTCLLMQ